MVIGVLMVNAENSGAGLYSDPLEPAHDRRRRARVASAGREPLPRALAWGWLVLLAFAYRSSDVTGLVQLRPHWWGILGLIGWAYLVAAAAYLLAGERPAVLVGLVGLLYCLLSGRRGRAGRLAPGAPARLQRGPGPELTPGDHALRDGPGNPAGAPPARRRGGAGPWCGAPWATRPAWPPRASCSTRSRRCTPPSGSASSSRPPPGACSPRPPRAPAGWPCSCWSTSGGFGAGRRLSSSPARTPCVAYLMAPFLLSLFALSAPLFGGTNVYAALGRETWVGLLRSALFAWMVVRLCGLMRSRGLRLQL